MVQIITYLLIVILSAFTMYSSGGTTEDVDIVGTPDADVEEAATEEEEIIEEMKV